MSNCSNSCRPNSSSCSTACVYKRVVWLELTDENEEIGVGRGEGYVAGVEVESSGVATETRSAIIERYN